MRELGAEMSTMKNISNITRTGADGCQCIDASDILASLGQRSCKTSGGENGVLLTVNLPCVDYTYGSEICRPHDVMVDPDCQLTGSETESDVPSYCNRPWCYVDRISCMGGSSERVFRSTYFPHESDVDLFYSYSTCGSSADIGPKGLELHSLGMGGKTLTAVTPAFNSVPYSYKRDANGNIPAVPGSEYYNNSVPAEGVHVNLAESLAELSDGDFAVNFIHASRGANRLFPGSPGNAAVQDVVDGLADIAVGPIWITGDRLERSAFTMPLQYDKTVLVVPRQLQGVSIIEESKKVLDPFTPGVWGLLLGVIMVTALLSVWFSGKRSRRPSVYARLFIDEFLQKGIFFCSAGVEHDGGSSLSLKVLMFGFAFFILIVVSAYVANLAAFLTRANPGYLDKIDDVIAHGWKICAHPVLEGDLHLAHPDATFIFNQEGKEFFGIVEDYDAGRCDVMAVGKMDTLDDLKLMDLFCERNLVYTESLVVENPVGFPIRPDLASSFSHWVHRGEKYEGISVHTLHEEYKKEFKRKPTCEVILSRLGDESGEYAKIDVKNLLLPIMWFLGFALIAALLQIYYHWGMKQARTQAVSATGSDANTGVLAAYLMGRQSTLDIRASMSSATAKSLNKIDNKEDDDENSCDALLAQIENKSTPIETGTIISKDDAQIDRLSENMKSDLREENQCRIPLNSSPQVIDKNENVREGSNLFSDAEHVAAVSQLERKFDDFFILYQQAKGPVRTS